MDSSSAGWGAATDWIATGAGPDPLAGAVVAMIIAGAGPYALAGAVVVMIIVCATAGATPTGAFVGWAVVVTDMIIVSFKVSVWCKVTIRPEPDCIMVVIIGTVEIATGALPIEEEIGITDACGDDPLDREEPIVKVYYCEMPSTRT